MAKRGIRFDVGQRKGYRDELIQTLEGEDDDARFEHFTELPAELRVRIYGYYYSAFSRKPLHAPKQPPITLTSSLIRRESLPVFYASCKFELRLHMRTVGGSTQGPFVPSETLMWLHNTRAEDLARIETIPINVIHYGTLKYDGNRKFTHRISKAMEVKAALRNIELSSSELGGPTLKKPLMEVAHDRGGSRHKGWTVEKEDIFELRKAIARWLR